MKLALAQTKEEAENLRFYARGKHINQFSHDWNNHTIVWLYQSTSLKSGFSGRHSWCPPTFTRYAFPLVAVGKREQHLTLTEHLTPQTIQGASAACRQTILPATIVATALPANGQP